MKEDSTKRALVIEGCFDLLHDDHRAFIDRCIEQFVAIYGYNPSICVRVMSNAWAHKKGDLRPLIDIKDRIETVKKYLTSHEDVTVLEADQASFEYQDKAIFEKTFENTSVAISRENLPKVNFNREQYMVIEPLNRFHTSDLEKLVLEIMESSSCAVRKVGAILLQDGHVIRQGTNTCICSKDESCTGCKAFLSGDIAKSRELGCSGMHAEASVLANISNDQVTKETIILTTTAPCVDCAQRIADIGIKAVVYFNEWERLSTDGNSTYIDSSGIDLLKSKRITVRKAGSI